MELLTSSAIPEPESFPLPPMQVKKEVPEPAGFNFATKISSPMPQLVCRGFTMGKLVDFVNPVT